jgi:hypothetical protein
MTILLEGVSLVFKNDTLDAQCPGGVLGFQAAWDNGSFCTDGTLSRISFFETGDAFCALVTMPDYGLEVSTHFAADVAVFLHGGFPWVPCLWLETSNVMTSKSEMQVCWHITEEQGSRFAVPKYFRANATLACYRHLDEEAIMGKVTRIGEKNGLSLFRDEMSHNIFVGPRPLIRH